MIPAAVIGCGRMGVFTSPSIREYAPAFWLPQSHADAIVAHPETQLVALCDASEAALARAGEAHPNARTFSHHKDLLDAMRPKLVGIATRTLGRAGIIEEVIAGGAQALHVEKPLCNSIAELERLERLFVSPGLFVTYGTLRRFFQIYHDAVSLAQSGKYGALQEIRFDTGAGALFWTHPHSVDLILWAAGDRNVVSVQARLGEVQADEGTGIIKNDPQILAADVWFGDGLRGSIGRSIGSALHLACARGTVSVLSNGASLEVQALEGDAPYPVRRTVATAADYSTAEGTLAPIGQLIDCLKGSPAAAEKNGRVKRDILLSQRILFAMVESHLRAGAAVSLDEISADRAVRAQTGELFA